MKIKISVQDIVLWLFLGVCAVVINKATELHTIENLASVRAERNLDPADDPILETYEEECAALFAAHDQAQEIDKDLADNIWVAVAAVCGDF